ncbi:MAG: RNA polymerase sigma factor [Oscillibacter sp.]|nr:RNA polymerase sigma factor [Oscillibacter sp.]
MNKKEEKLTSYLLENQSRFYRLAYSYLGSREDALDAVQTAVCRALEKQRELKNEDAVATWFYRILVNICTDQLRRRKRVIFVPPEALDTGSYDDPAPDDSLYRQVNALPPEIQTVVKLRFYEELSLQEIAQVTGWNLNTVKTRLYGGLKKLRVSLEEQL